MKKYTVILNTTTFCNLNCSYCNVIKDEKNLSAKTINNILYFIKLNNKNIEKIKFFWWEPLLAFKNIRYIIDNSNIYIKNKFEIVTNTTLLNDEIWKYFNKYFETIFFSIDTENIFNYDYVIGFINKYNLNKKVYFNLVISPWNEEESLSQFTKLLFYWFTNFNILPVYFTQNWSDKNLRSLSNVMKVILDKNLKNKEINLYGFQQNNWYKASLIDNSIFIEIDWNIFYSDIVITTMWEKIKEKLKIWKLETINIMNLKEKDFIKYSDYISIVEEYIYNNIIWQRKLHNIMDYFSVYLNSK